LRIFANAEISSSEGQTSASGAENAAVALVQPIAQGHVSGDGDHRNASLRSAVCIAISKTRGICSGCETSSQ